MHFPPLPAPAPRDPRAGRQRAAAQAPAGPAAAPRARAGVAWRRSPTPGAPSGPTAAPCSLAGATLLTLGGTLAMTATNLAGTLVLARALGPEGKGAVGAVLLVAALASYAGSPGLAPASIHAVARLGLPPAAVRGNALAAAAVLGLVTAIAALALAPHLLARAGPEAVQAGRLVFLCTPLALAQDYSLALLQGLGRYDLFTVGRTLGRALYPALLVALGLAGALSVTTALAAWAVAAPAGLLLLWGLVDRAGAGQPQLRLDLLPRYAGYGLRLHLGTLAELIELRLDQLLLVLLLPPAALGQYTLAVTASELLTCLPSALAVVLLGSPAAGPAAARAAAQRAIRRALAALAAAGLLAALAAPWLVTRLLPASFAPAATAFQLLVPGTLALGLGRMLAGALAGQGHPLAAAPARLVSLGLTLVLAPLLIPRLGIAGAAVASTVASSGAALCLLEAGRRALGWRWQAFVLPGARRAASCPLPDMRPRAEGDAVPAAGAPPPRHAAAAPAPPAKRRPRRRHPPAPPQAAGTGAYRTGAYRRGRKEEGRQSMTKVRRRNAEH